PYGCFGKGNISRVQHHEKRRRYQAVNTEQHDAGEQVPEAQYRNGNHCQKSEQENIDQLFHHDRLDPCASAALLLSSSQGCRPLARAALANAWAAVGEVNSKKAKISPSLTVARVKPK